MTLLVAAGGTVLADTAGDKLVPAGTTGNGTAAGDNGTAADGVTVLVAVVAVVAVLL